MTETSRCTGHCCKVFTLPFTPAQLKQAARYSRRWREKGRRPGFASENFRVSRYDGVERVHEIVQWLGVRDGFGKLLALGTPDDLKGLAAKEAATSLPTGSLPTCSLPTMEEAFITLVERASEEDA